MSNLGVIGELNESIRNVWKIPNFSSLKKDKCFYESPSFNFINTTLYIRIYPPSDDDRSSLFVYLLNEPAGSCDVTISMSLQKSDGSFAETKTVNRTIQSSHDVCNEFSVNACQLREKKSELLPEDTLTIVCDIKTGKQALPPAGEANSCKEKTPVETSQHMELTEIDLLSKNLKDLLTNKDCSDAILLVQGKEFKAHKNILITRSSVFAAMFRHDTAEKQSGVVTIPDCDPDSFQQFLEYLYCGRLEDISSNSAVHLYKTSDKYNVQELKAFCVKHLMQNITVENVCEVAILADQYDEIKMLSSVQEFFNKNLKKILATSEWENLFKKNFRLANKLLIDMSKGKD